VIRLAFFASFASLRETGYSQFSVCGLLRQAPLVKYTRARLSNCLLSRGSQVRVLPGVPLFSIFPALLLSAYTLPRLISTARTRHQAHPRGPDRNSRQQNGPMRCGLPPDIQSSPDQSLQSFFGLQPQSFLRSQFKSARVVATSHTFSTTPM
jgi:hypothetical protein